MKYEGEPEVVVTIWAGGVEKTLELWRDPQRDEGEAEILAFGIREVERSLRWVPFAGGIRRHLRALARIADGIAT